jgi:hypothetical protein
LERSDNLGIQTYLSHMNPERVRQPPNPFRCLIHLPGFSMLEPGAQISERLRRNFKMNRELMQLEWATMRFRR